MLKKLEAWLRRIFSDEVSKVETAIKKVEDSFTSELERIETSFAAEREKYLAEIRDTIEADLKQFRADLVAENLLRAAPLHWKADAETLQQDHALRRAK